MIPDLVMSGAFQHLDHVHIDWTRWGQANKGSLKTGFLEKLGLFSQPRGGGLAISSFYSFFPNKFALELFINVIK